MEGGGGVGRRIGECVGSSFVAHTSKSSTPTVPPNQRARATAGVLGVYLPGLVGHKPMARVRKTGCVACAGPTIRAGITSTWSTSSTSKLQRRSVVVVVGGIPVLSNSFPPRYLARASLEAVDGKLGRAVQTKVVRCCGIVRRKVLLLWWVLFLLLHVHAVRTRVRPPSIAWCHS